MLSDYGEATRAKRVLWRACKSDGNHGEMLVVDDDARMRELVTKVLAREGYSVRPRHVAKMSCRPWRRDQPSSSSPIFQMPEMDGLTLLQEVKRVAPKTSVLLMTAFGSIDTAVQAMKAGAYDYLTKPFKMDEPSLWCDAPWRSGVYGRKSRRCGRRSAPNTISPTSSARASRCRISLH